MSTANVKDFTMLYYPTHAYEKLEWIDDSSLNIVYESEEVAKEALAAFSTEIGSKLPYWEIRETKRSESHPLARLEVRIATEMDKKEVCLLLIAYICQVTSSEEILTRIMSDQ